MRVRLSLALASLPLLLSLIACAGQPQTPSQRYPHLNEQGLRQSHYRAPTPPAVPRARTLDVAGLRRLLERDHALLIDVHPVLERPELSDLGFDWLINTPRSNITNSVWLPNVGYGELKPHQKTYFQHHLDRLTGGDRGHALVFYCNADCWMSWNAVQRAHRYGYRNLFWYRDGIEGWVESGGVLSPAEPEPYPHRP